jgi:hypothetical protein
MIAIKINPRLIYASITGNHAFATSPTTASLTSVSKGMVRRAVQKAAGYDVVIEGRRYAYVCTWDFHPWLLTWSRQRD